MVGLDGSYRKVRRKVLSSRLRLVGKHEPSFVFTKALWTIEKDIRRSTAQRASKHFKTCYNLCLRRSSGEHMLNIWFLA